MISRFFSGESSSWAIIFWYFTESPHFGVFSQYLRISQYFTYFSLFAKCLYHAKILHYFQKCMTYHKFHIFALFHLHHPKLTPPASLNSGNNGFFRNFGFKTMWAKKRLAHFHDFQILFGEIQFLGHYFLVFH